MLQSTSSNIGTKLENAVYLELWRCSSDVFYYSGDNECDFIIREGANITAAYQVTATMKDPKTRRRELDGLISAMKVFGLNEGQIITVDEYEEIEGDGLSIKVLPYYRWVLENSVLS